MGFISALPNRERERAQGTKVPCPSVPSILVLEDFARAQRAIDARKGAAAFNEFFRTAAAIAGIHNLVIGAPLIALLMQGAVAAAAAITVEEVGGADILDRMRFWLGGGRAPARDRKRECTSTHHENGDGSHGSIDPDGMGEAGIEFTMAQGPIDARKGKTAFDEFLRGAVTVFGIHDPVFRAPLIALLVQQAITRATAIAMEQIGAADILIGARRMADGLGLGDLGIGARLGGCAQAGTCRGDGEHGGYQKRDGSVRHAQTIAI